MTELCQEVTRLHSQYTPLLLSLAEETTTSVAPMIRPTWWLCPTLSECLTADQREYILPTARLSYLSTLIGTYEDDKNDTAATLEIP